MNKEMISIISIIFYSMTQLNEQLASYVYKTSTLLVDSITQQYDGNTETY